MTQTLRGADIVMRTLDRAGHTTIYAYDLAGLLTKTVDGSGATTLQSYDSAERLIHTVANGHTSSTTYDSAGRVNTSLSTSLRLSGAFFESVFFASARTRRMTSPARVPSRTIRWRAACASFMLGGSPSSQLKAASALNMTAPSG